MKVFFTVNWSLFFQGRSVAVQRISASWSLLSPPHYSCDEKPAIRLVAYLGTLCWVISQLLELHTIWNSLNPVHNNYAVKWLNVVRHGYLLYPRYDYLCFAKDVPWNAHNNLESQWHLLTLRVTEWWPQQNGV